MIAGRRNIFFFVFFGYTGLIAWQSTHLDANLPGCTVCLKQLPQQMTLIPCKAVGL